MADDELARQIAAVRREIAPALPRNVDAKIVELAAFSAMGRRDLALRVWKDARELGKSAGESAVQLCKDKDVKKVTGTADFASPGGNTLTSILLKPQPITKDNLNVVIDAGWTTKDNVCKDVPAGSVSVCS